MLTVDSLGIAKFDQGDLPAACQRYENGSNERAVCLALITCSQ